MSSAATLIAVFQSTHETLRAEKEFKERSLKVHTTVKPRNISSNCQLAITFNVDDIGIIEEVIEEQKLDFLGFYRKTEDGEWGKASA